MVKIKAQDAADPEASTLKELPGFRFHPTDEELVNFYLRRRLLPQRSDSALSLLALLIPDIDIYRYDPWDLPTLVGLARLGEGSSGYYFFSPRGKKYRNSARPNRVTLSGFWKATGTDRLVYSDSSNSKCIGLKKSLVFYHGRASRSMKSDWIMHEFRLASHQDCSENDACWALCKIFKRKSSNSQHSMVRSSLPQATIDISESTESFEAEESNEEDVKSEATRCAPLNPLCNDLLTSSSGILPPSSYHSEMKEAAVVGLEGPPKLTSPAAGASALAPKAPLTVRMSQSNSWANDLLSSWMSPTGMKLSGQPCLAARDGNLWCNDQPFQESVMPADCLWPSSSLSPSMSDSILSLWD